MLQVAFLSQQLSDKLDFALVIHNILSFVDQETRTVHDSEVFVSQLSVLVPQENRLVPLKVVVEITVDGVKIEVEPFKTVGQRYFTVIFFGLIDWPELIFKRKLAVNCSI